MVMNMTENIEFLEQNIDFNDVSIFFDEDDELELITFLIRQLVEEQSKIIEHAKRDEFEKSIHISNQVSKYLVLIEDRFPGFKYLGSRMHLDFIWSSIKKLITIQD